MWALRRSWLDDMERDTPAAQAAGAATGIGGGPCREPGPGGPVRRPPCPARCHLSFGSPSEVGWLPQNDPQVVCRVALPDVAFAALVRPDAIPGH